jgi:hypothetical protein
MSDICSNYCIFDLKLHFKQNYRNRVTSVSFYMTTSNNIVMSIQTSATTDSPVTPTLSPYAKFKMALKSKEVKRQYPSVSEINVEKNR